MNNPKYSFRSLKIPLVLQLVGGKSFKWLFCGVLASLILAGVEYLLAAFIQVFISNIGLMDAAKLPEVLRPYADVPIWVISITLAAIGFARGTGHFLSTFSAQVFCQLVSTRLRLTTIYEALLKTDATPLASSEVHFRYSEIFSKTGDFVRQVVNTIALNIQLLIILGGMLYLAPYETLMSLFGLSFIWLVLKGFNRLVLESATRYVEEQSQITKSLERVTRYNLFVRISGTQQSEFEKLTNQTLNYFVYAIRSIRYAVLSATFPPIVGIFILSIVIYLSHKHLTTSSSSLIAFLYLFVRFTQQLGNSVSALSVSFSYLPQFSKAMETFHRLNSEEHEDALQGIDFLTRFGGLREKFTYQSTIKLKHHDPNLKLEDPLSIRIKDLDFQWGIDSPFIFSNKNLEIKNGSTLGIMGPSGVGKSTLLSLILGVISPTRGSVLIGGMPSTQFLQDYNDLVGYVGADSFLFHGTIRENLCYGLAQEASEEDIIEALEKAEIWEDVSKLSKKLDFEISENDKGLSTGQQQRLALARAFLRHPRILILDEASANLDAETEMKIAKTIDKNCKDKIVIIVSHRKGILTYVDELIELNNSPKTE